MMMTIEFLSNLSNKIIFEFKTYEKENALNKISVASSHFSSLMAKFLFFHQFYGTYKKRTYLQNRFFITLGNFRDKAIISEIHLA